jgi:hypothetical protein
MPSSVKKSTKKPTTAPSKSAAKTVRKPTVKSTSLLIAKPLSKPVPTAVKAVLTKIPVKTSVSKTITKVAAKAVPKNLLEKPIKAKKIKLVRDSFTIPKPEYLVLDNLKLRATDLKQPTKKSELLRAGIKALALMTDQHFLAALKAVPMLKTGRPSK